MASGAEADRIHRILVQSDQHLEQSDWQIPRDLPPHDVAVFAGDLYAPVAGSVRLLAAERDAGIGLARDIVFVPGNHEFYGHDLDASLAEGRAAAAELGIHLLDGDEVVLHGVRYLGATLWTDYGLQGNAPLAMALATRDMNDHAWIRHGEGRFLPERARAIHRERVDWLAERLSTPHDGPTVVVTHHCPSPSSVHPSYERDPLNPAFASNLDGLIRVLSPDLWIHAHTHRSFDYVLWGTRVVCNPKGYGPGNGRPGIENASGFDPLLVVELPFVRGP